MVSANMKSGTMNVVFVTIFQKKIAQCYFITNLGYLLKQSFINGKFEK